MGIFKWIFRKDKEISKSEITPTHDHLKEEPPKTNMASISEVNPNAVPKDSAIVYQSPIPKSCTIGNLIEDKKYEEAIELGLKLLKENPKDASILINLMDAYFKGKEIVAPDYIDKSTYYAKQSILNGHHTGYAEQRLAINLDKAKLFHQSLQLYNLILDTEGFHFSSHGCGNFINWKHRRESILKKMDKAMDTENDVLFTPSEIAQIIQNIKDDDNKEEQEKERYTRIMNELKIALKNREYDKYDKLFKELHNRVE